MDLGLTAAERLPVRRVLVTGVGGLHGSWEAQRLVELGYEVHGVDDLSGGFRHNVPKGCRFARLDLRRREAVARYVARIRPELIFHDASFATEGASQFTPINSTERNQMMYLYLLVPAIRHGLKKIVVASSMSVYGRQRPPFTETMGRAPEDVYAVSKAALEHVTELLARVHGFAYTIIRPQNVYGPRQNLRDPYRNVISIWINALMNGKPFWIYGDGRQERSFTYVEDFTPCVLRAGLGRRFAGEIFNVCSEEEISLNRLADLVLTAYFGSPAACPKRLRPRHYRPGRPLEVKRAYCSNAKARRLLGYRTTVPVAEGVRRMVAWARSVGPQPFRYLAGGLELPRNAPPTWTRRLY